MSFTLGVAVCIHLSLHDRSIHGNFFRRLQWRFCFFSIFLVFTDIFFSLSRSPTCEWIPTIKQRKCVQGKLWGPLFSLFFAPKHGKVLWPQNVGSKTNLQQLSLSPLCLAAPSFIGVQPHAFIHTTRSAFSFFQNPGNDFLFPSLFVLSYGINL